MRLLKTGLAYFEIHRRPTIKGTSSNGEKITPLNFIINAENTKIQAPCVHRRLAIQ